MRTRSYWSRSLLLVALVAAWPVLASAQSLGGLDGGEEELIDGVPGDPAPSGGGSDTLLDFDGEGHSDILLRNAHTNECLLWLMRGARIQVLVPLPGLDADRDVVGNGDYNGDGYADLLQHDPSNGEVSMMLIEGSASLGEAHVATIGPDSEVVGSGDYDGDGVSEIAVHNRDTGVIELWDVDGAEIVDAKAVPDSKGAGWQIVGSGDFDGDGDDDLLWQETDTGRLDLWRLEGLDLAEEVVLRERLRRSWRVVGTGHYTSDHLADVLLHDTKKGRFEILRTRLAAQGLRLDRLQFDRRPSPGSEVVHSGDFDSDGVLEIVLRDARSGSIEMWFANGGKVQAAASLGELESAWVPAGIGLESPATHRRETAVDTID